MKFIEAAKKRENPGWKELSTLGAVQSGRMTDEFEIAKAINAGKLELLCPKMELLRCPSYHDVLLEGTGVIQTNEDGSLAFQMVAPIVPWSPDPVLNPSRPHGELYEPHDHVMLRALDYRGREWRSNWFLAKPIHPNTGSPNLLVSHRLTGLSSFAERRKSNTSEGRMYLPQQGRLSFDASTRTTRTVRGNEIETCWSCDHHVRKINDAEVEFRSEDGHWLVVTAKQSAPVMPDWGGLLCQALSFATAQSVRPAVAVREFDDRSFTHVFSGPFSSFRTYLTPPIVSLGPQTTSDFWTLVQRFVEAAKAEEARAAVLFSELDGIRSGSSGSIQTACLTLAIGIESLADLLLRDEVILRDTAMDAEIEGLFKHIEAWSGDGRLKKRANGMLGPLRGGVRAVDRLYAFTKRNGVPDESVLSWKTLREMKAHGRTMENPQRLLDLYYSAVELFYRIVCSSIGYAGRLTTTSERGWGVDQWGFPLSRQ